MIYLQINQTTKWKINVNFFWYLALSLRLCLTLLVFLERADRSCVWVFLSCWTERGKMWNKCVGFLLQVNSGLPKHQVMYVSGWPYRSLFLSLSSHLAANVIALELVAGCWLNGISGIFARGFVPSRPGAIDQFRVCVSGRTNQCAINYITLIHLNV